MRQHGFDTTWLLTAGDSGDRGRAGRAGDAVQARLAKGLCLAVTRVGTLPGANLEAALCGCEHANLTCRYGLHTGDFAKHV